VLSDSTILAEVARRRNYRSHRIKARMSLNRTWSWQQHAD
jgi:hypothetical protein